MDNLDALKLQVIHEACRIIGHALDLDQALRDVLHILGERLPTERATIALMDEELGHLKIRASYGLSSAEEARGIYGPGEGVTGKVFLTGEPCIILDITQEPLFLDRTRARARSLSKSRIAFLAVPILLEEQPTGVLSVDRLFSSTIDYQEDLKFLEIIALIIGQFVQLQNIVRQRESMLKQENLVLRTELSKRLNDFMVSSKSPEMQKAVALIKRVAPTKANVLLLGESGTGKTLTARLIHELSSRASRPMVKINCAALPENLLEAELFGYEKGAFTGATSSKPGRLEEAHGGTAFLDEIGELSPGLQAKLLRFVQEREFERLGSTKTRQVDVRIIAATNRDLTEMIERGEFREDLYFRLNVFPISIPPLRQRKEDLPLLINFILRRLGKEYGRELRFTPECIDLLSQHEWPGNVRELENFLERLFIVCEGSVIRARDVLLLMKKGAKRATAPTERQADTDIKPTIIRPSELSKEDILEVLERNSFIMGRAAKELGLSFRQLRYRISKLGLDQQIPIKRGRPATAVKTVKS